MKQVVKKRVLAVLFAIAMILGIFPANQSVKVEAATVYSSTYFYISEFRKETLTHVNNINSYVESNIGLSMTAAVDISSNGFVSEWNKMSYNQTFVVINTHGTPDSLQGILSASNIKKLNYKNIRCIVLLGCNCGHYSYRTTNIARAFADRFNCPVIAADGTVYYAGRKPDGKNNPKADSTWKSLAKKAGDTGSLNYGWMVYIPKNSSNNYQGKLYTMGRFNATVKDLLYTYYNKHAITSVPVR